AHVIAHVADAHGLEERDQRLLIHVQLLGDFVDPNLAHAPRSTFDRPTPPRSGGPALPPPELPCPRRPERAGGGLRPWTAEMRSTAWTARRSASAMGREEMAMTPMPGGLPPAGSNGLEASGSRLESDWTANGLFTAPSWCGCPRLTPARTPSLPRTGAGAIAPSRCLVPHATARPSATARRTSVRSAAAAASQATRTSSPSPRLQAPVTASAPHTARRERTAAPSSPSMRRSMARWMA